MLKLMYVKQSPGSERLGDVFLSKLSLHCNRLYRFKKIQHAGRRWVLTNVTVSSRQSVLLAAILRRIKTFCDGILKALLVVKLVYLSFNQQPAVQGILQADVLAGSLTCRLPNVLRSPPARRSLKFSHY